MEVLAGFTGVMLLLVGVVLLFFTRSRRKSPPVHCQPVDEDSGNGVGVVRGLNEKREKAQGSTQKINYELLGICLRSKPLSRGELADLARKKARRRERRLVQRV
jgi:hypothetical protein